MKRQISLKWFVVLSLLAMTIVLVIGYSLLSVHFFIRGMDSIIAANMVKVVESYVSAIPADHRRRLNSFSGYQISPDWSGMPEKIRMAFKEPQQPEVLLKHDDSGWFAPPDAVHFVMRVAYGGQIYFISHTLTRETASPLVGHSAAQTRQLLLVLSASTVFALAAMIWLLFKRIARPVNALGHWARSLNESNLDRPPPDFTYPELNQLADLIRGSLSSVQESLAREHRFLRHSSHELRTPISVIRNNVELLRKLQENSAQGWQPRQKQIIERIDRASTTMKNVTETLLWLSRDSEVDLPVKTLDFEQMIQGLVTEALYLLKDKEVKLSVETVACAITVAEIPARIVLGNLIRNAFQYTWRGTIHIVQKEGTVEIANDTADGNDATQDLGFGLGLRLVEQLTRKLNWTYTSGREQGRHRARVSLGGTL